MFTHIVHFRPLDYPNNVKYESQEHEDGSDNDNVAPMDDDLWPVEQRKEHPHLTDISIIIMIIVENV